MSTKRPNTVILLILLLGQAVYLLVRGALRGGRALLTGQISPVKPLKLSHIWHWIAFVGPRKFWKFPRTIQIGRSLSTLIQVIFYRQ